MVTGKFERLTIQEREKITKRLSIKRDKYESKHHRGYRKIYPIEGHEKYNKYQIYKQKTSSYILITRGLFFRRKNANLSQFLFPNHAINQLN